MTSARAGYLPLEGAQLYVRESGDGPPMVALHGGPDFNHRYLLPELDALAQYSRVICYDQRGRGLSSAGVEPGSVTIDSEVEDLDALRRHFGIEAWALLGHSWGALLAMEYAVRYPQRVSHLVLMNTAPASHPDMLRFRAHRQASEAGALEVMEAISATAAYPEGDVAAEAHYYRAHFGSTLPPRLLDMVVQRLRVDFSSKDILKARAIESRLYAQTWDSPDYNLIPRLARIDAPTLVLHGDRDFVPLDCARHVAEAIPQAKLIVLEDCGHFSLVERPAEVVAAVGDLLTMDART